MKFIFLILFFLFSNLSLANETENSQVEVINLYESKSLDQMVLDNLNSDTDIEEISESIEEIETIQDEVKQVEIIKGNFFFENETKDLKKYFENIKKIDSDTLQIHLVEVLENLQLNLENETDKEIFFMIINYFKSIGQINKSYELIEKYDLTKDQNFNFYTSIKINYLLSTFQLNEACNIKDDVSSAITLDHFFLEKLDIFCLILNNNISEANLLNSILIESENDLDNYYQLLFALINSSFDETNIDTEINNNEINPELIFLYSAMIRIAELPFSHSFYEFDKKNLSIPIILNQASSIDLRIKAANESFLDNLINVDSLSALYMSADFDSDQLTNPKKTLETYLDNKEMSMAFLFQLVNIQIFPTDRLNALIQFWDYATKNNLEDIAYKLSNNMLSSIEPNSNNILYSPQIALAYIFNENFDKAVSWIELYESTKEIDSKITYVRILLDLYSTNDLNSFIDSIKLTLSNYIDNQNNQNEELLFVLNDVMNLEINFDDKVNLNKIYDERLMPSIFLFNEIKNSIYIKNDEKFLIYSLISLNNKEWSNIHPEHLKLILKGFLNYNDGILFRNLILEVFKNYKFIL